jgi:hypothetical protein
MDRPIIQPEETMLRFVAWFSILLFIVLSSLIFVLMIAAGLS